MALNVTSPSSVNVGQLISLRWDNTYGDSYFTISRQTNNNTTWQGVPYPTGSNLTRYSEQAESTWTRVRYRISGLPSQTISTTGWITVVGGTDPGDPGGPGGGDPIDPDPILTTPIIIVPHTVPPQTSFEIRWSDSNVDATYELEEEVNNGNWQSLNTTITSKTYYRIALASWNNVRYRVRAKKGSQITAWSYSLMITIESLFPKMSVKVGSEVRNAVDGWVMVNGTLRKITDIWVMVNGTLKKS